MSQGQDKQYDWTLRRRPALAAAVALTIGIASYRALPPNPAIYLAIAGGLALIAAATLRRAFSTIPLLVAIFFCGVTAAQLRGFFFPATHIAQYASDETRLARLELRIAETPKVFSDPFAHAHRSPAHQSFRASVLRIDTTSGWTPCTGTVFVNMTLPRDDLATGQVIRALAYLQYAPPATNPGQFDWAAQLRRERILVTLHIPHPQHLAIIGHESPGVLSLLRDKTRELLSLGFVDPRSINHLMLRALLLGDNDPELRDVRSAFQHTGTAHLLAISGLHIVIVWWFIFTLCRLLRFRPSITLAFTAATVIVYGLAALPSTPAMRAVTLCLALTFALLLRRRVDSVQLLSVICFAMLIIDPLALFTPGFQLSFGCVLALMALSGTVVAQLHRLRDRDIEIAESFRPKTGLAAIPGWLRSHFEQALAGGIIAWCVCIPIVESHFNQLNIWSIPCALILSPFTFASIIAGLLKIVLTFILPWFAHTWAVTASVPISVLRSLALMLEKLPGSDFPLRVPPPWIIACYFAAVILVFAPIAAPMLKYATRTIAIILLALFAVLLFLVGATNAGTLQVTLLSVGNGRCMIIETPGADPVMIDAGAARISEVESGVIAPFLRSRGIDRIGWLILADGDYDDINAAADVARDFSPRKVFASTQLRKPAKETYATHRMLAEFDEMKRSPEVIAQDQRIDIDRGDTVLEAIWPPNQTKLAEHDCGLVLKLSYAGKSLLFPANIDIAAQRELLKHPDKLKADVLIAPHHGTTNATTADFITAVNPSIVLSSNAGRMTEKQKNLPATVGDRKLYRTDTCGAITVMINRDGKITITPFLK